jgi:hypothetical protein
MNGMRYEPAVLAALLIMAGTRAERPAPPQKPVAIVAELFTSEGCSSCPPADELLRRLVDEQPIAGVEVVGLSEHVDYWDRLGWKDPFSSARFSRRQEEYSQIFGDDRIYTPQMVISGRDEMVGSEAGRIQSAISKAATRPMAMVSVDGATSTGKRSAAVRIDIQDVPEAARRADLDVVLAVIENGLESHVKAGENAKRTLKHSAVTRSLGPVGKLSKGSSSGSFTTEVALVPAWNPAQVRLVAFLQNPRTHEIHGAAVTALRLP